MTLDGLGVVDVPIDWERRINAEKLLADAFREFSEAGVCLTRQDKTRHSVAITEWLIEYKPETFRELWRDCSRSSDRLASEKVKGNGQECPLHTSCGDPKTQEPPPAGGFQSPL